MSKETHEWLNTMTLIGYVSNRGHAWHYSEDEQGDENNHYELAIPVADVERRLFNWEPVKLPEQWEYNGVTYTSDKDVVVVRSDTGAKLGTFRNTYQPHGYREWLITNVSTLLDTSSDDLGIASAGLLKGGAQAWVQVEMPDNIKTPEGVEFRPYLLAATSFDGSLATTYKRGITNVVCDNTMAAGLAEAGEVFKVKHTAHSMKRIGDAREALGIVYDIAESFQEEVTALASTTVSERQWRKFLDAYSPIPSDEGSGQTRAQNRQDKITALWNNDHRVNPWKGTAWGVVQAVNTYVHHEQTVRGDTERAERNKINAVKGDFDTLDKDTAALLSKVLVNA